MFDIPVIRRAPCPCGGLLEVIEKTTMPDADEFSHNYISETTWEIKHDGEPTEQCVYFKEWLIEKLKEEHARKIKEIMEGIRRNLLV